MQGCTVAHTGTFRSSTAPAAACRPETAGTFAHTGGMKRNGRVRCGACDVVLHDPDARRRPTGVEEAELKRTPSSLAKGRRLYALTRPADLAFTGTLDPDAGTLTLLCKRCKITYRVRLDDLARRRLLAVDDGLDVRLGHADRTSPARTRA